MSKTFSLAELDAEIASQASPSTFSLAELDAEIARQANPKTFSLAELDALPPLIGGEANSVVGGKPEFLTDADFDFGGGAAIDSGSFLGSDAFDYESGTFVGGEPDAPVAEPLWKQAPVADESGNLPLWAQAPLAEEESSQSAWMNDPLVESPGGTLSPAQHVDQFNKQIAGIEQYHKSLPYPMDSYSQIDEDTHARYIRMNELATGEVYRYSEDKQGRRGELAKELSAMHGAGFDDPAEWLASQEVKEGSQNLVARSAKQFAGDFIGGVENVSNSILGQSHLVRASQLEAGWDEQVASRKDADSVLGTFAGGVVRKTAGVLGKMTPALAAGYATGGSTAVLGLVGGQAGVESFGRARAKGWSQAESTIYGSLVAGIEAAFTFAGGKVAGKFGLATLEEAFSKGAGRSFLKAIAGSAVEGAEEVATEIAQGALDVISDMDPEALENANLLEVAAIGMLASSASHVPSVANFIANPTRTNARKASIPPELTKTKKQRDEVARQAEVASIEIKSVAGLSNRINNLEKKGLLDDDVLADIRSMAETDPRAAKSIFTEAERRAEEHNDHVRLFREEFGNVFGDAAATKTQTAKRSAAKGSDEVGTPIAFDIIGEQLRDDPSVAPQIYSQAMELGQGHLEDGLFEVLQGGQNQQAMKKADDFIGDVADEAMTSFDTGSSGEVDSDLADAEFAPEGMPNVADIPGSAPKGRFGPLESEQAFRTVETSAEALVDVDKPITPQEIIQSVEEVGQAFGADVPIRANLLGRAKKSLGYYMPSQAVIRLQSRFDAATAAHEVGHAALRGMKIDSPEAMQKAVGRVAHGEMVRLGRALYGDKKPAGGYYNEGLAEFFRYYIARSPEAAKKKSPRFYEAFETLVANHPGGLEAMQKAQQQIKLWGDQGAIARLDAQQVDPSSRKYKRREALRRWKKKKPIVRHIEEFEPLREYTRAYQSGGGEQVEGTVFDPYAKAKERRGRSNAHLDRMIEVEMVDINGNPVGESLHEALAPIEAKDYEDFQRYLFARRALALYDSEIGARDPGIARDDAEYNYNTFSSPRFEKAAHSLYQWWEGVLDYASDASPEIARNVQQTRKNNTEEFGVSHGYYVPLHRILDDDGRGVQSSSSGGKQLSGKLGKQLRGSALPVKEVLPQLVAKASSLMQAAHRRAVSDTVFSLYDSFKKDPRNQALGRYLEPIPEATLAIDVPLDQVIKKFRKALSVMGLSETEVFGMDGLDAVLDDPTDMTDVVDQALATFYKKSGKAKNAKNESPILTRFEDGKMTFYRVDPNLYDALLPAPVPLVQAIRNTPVLKQAHDAIVMTNSVARTGMVGLRAGFSLVTSPIRELQALAFHSAETNPLTLAHDFLSGVIEAGTYALSGGKVEMEWMKTLHRLGVQMASPLAEDSMNTRQAAKRAVESKADRLVDVSNWYYFVRDVFQSLDAAPRIAEMKRVARKHNWTPDKPLTEQVALEMGLQAKEITADFGAGSAESRALNNVFMFYNIAIQGPRATVRAAKDHPVRFMAGMATATALTLANWWDNKDEEWWKERNRREDFSYIRYRIGGEVLRIPINQEGSQIPQAIMVMMDAAYNRDPKAATEYFGAVIDLLMSSLPVLAQYKVEVDRNKRSYNDAPIVPNHLLRASPEDQFGAYTSETSKAIGAALKISPARLDHAVRAFAGGLGGDLLGASDTMMRLAKGDKEKSPGIREWADTPLVGRLLQRGGIYGTRPASFDKVYESYAKAEKRQFSTRNPETEDERQLRLQLLDGKKAMSALLNLRSLAVDSKGKRDLTRAAVKLAKDIVQDYESKNLRRGEWKRQRRKLVKEAKKAGG